jgi:hypothetical protein
MTAVVVHHVDQRTPEWKILRLGKLTGSRAADATAKIKSGAEAASVRNLRVQLVLERITGQPHDRDHKSWAMQQGIETEADAYAAYEALTGTLLRSVGFVERADAPMGCSLDGVVGDAERPTGVIEIKCPYSATHLDYLTTGKVPGDYLKQIAHSLYVTGAEWCDWLSFDPAFPAPLQAKLVRVHRKDVDIDGYVAEALAFLLSVSRREGEVRAMLERA